VTDDTYLVIGGGLAGAKAVEALRQEGIDGRVIMIGEEPELPYTRPQLSKGYLAGLTERGQLTVLEDGWYARHDVELLLGRRALSIDAGAQTVRLDRAERVGYDCLLLATGSGPRRLEIPGADLEGVRYLRRAGDADVLRAALAAGGPLVVVGGGWIALEVAALARTTGLDVTVVLPGPSPMLRSLGPEVGARLVALHEAHGTRVLAGRPVARAHGAGGRVEAVELEDGTRLPASVVVIDIGAEPCTELAVSAGVKVDDGVVVDATLRTDDPRIWAAGDLAMAENAWFGGRMRVDHVASADAQGRFAGRSMAGAVEAWTDAPAFGSDQYGTRLTYRGWADATAERVVFRETGDGRWAAFWLNGGRIAAVLRADPRPDARAELNGEADGREVVDELVLERAAVDLERLADRAIPWAATRVA
jgi:3-phenylpropionate/trans-cinnamate dioxygenase ferredoxin reductase component